MAMPENDVSMQETPTTPALQRELINSIEWSPSRTMTLSSIYAPSQITCFLKLISFLWKWSKPLVCIVIISVESLLLFQIYWPHTIYFRLSISFISIPLVISSLIIAYTSHQSLTSPYDSDRITHFSGLRRKCLELLLILPIINVLIVLLPPPTVLIKNRVHYTLAWQSIFLLILSVFMTFPQFILNICFILSSDSISLFNYLQIVTCVISLSIFSLLHYAYTYALDSIGEQISFLKAIKYQLFWSKFQYFTEIFFYIYFLIILLELIHCLPILFEYYHYNNININDMMYCLIAFNACKLLCFSPYIYHISIYKKTNCCCNCVRFILLLMVFIPLPLLPFMTITYKSLFEKRVLLIDKKRLKTSRKIKTKGTSTTINTLEDSIIRLRTTTEEASETNEQIEHGINERSPIHKGRTSTGSTTAELRRYHTMDSNQSTITATASTAISSITQQNEDMEVDESMESMQCQYLLFSLYLFIAYIACNGWLIINCGGILCLGLKTQVLIYVTYVCVFIAVVIYSPFVLKRVLNKAQLVLIGDLLNDDWDWI